MIRVESRVLVKAGLKMGFAGGWPELARLGLSQHFVQIGFAPIIDLEASWGEPARKLSRPGEVMKLRCLDTLTFFLPSFLQPSP